MLGTATEQCLRILNAMPMTMKSTGDTLRFELLTFDELLLRPSVE